jgi:hypothetical protein
MKTTSILREGVVRENTGETAGKKINGRMNRMNLGRSVTNSDVFCPIPICDSLESPPDSVLVSLVKCLKASGYKYKVFLYHESEKSLAQWFEEHPSISEDETISVTEWRNTKLWHEIYEKYQKYLSESPEVARLLETDIDKRIELNTRQGKASDRAGIREHIIRDVVDVLYWMEDWFCQKKQNDTNAFPVTLYFYAGKHTHVQEDAIKIAADFLGHKDMQCDKNGNGVLNENGAICVQDACLLDHFQYNIVPFKREEKDCKQKEQHSSTTAKMKMCLVPEEVMDMQVDEISVSPPISITPLPRPPSSGSSSSSSSPNSSPPSSPEKCSSRKVISRDACKQLLSFAIQGIDADEDQLTKFFMRNIGMSAHPGAEHSAANNNNENVATIKRRHSPERNFNPEPGRVSNIGLLKKPRTSQAEVECVNNKELNNSVVNSNNSYPSFGS